MSLLDKKPAYFIERFMGAVLGFGFGWVVYKYLGYNNSFSKEKYYDIIIKASTTLFGFLLTILALILNGASTSAIIKEIRESNAFSRLVKYHKVAVVLSFMVMLFSIIMFWITAYDKGFNGFISDYGEITFKMLVSLHSAISIWCAVDTLIFVRIFYKIILS